MALTYLPTFLIIGVVAFDLWVWKWPGVARIANHPRIGGTWRARLQPHPDSHIPRNGNRGPIEAAMIIEQTYWTLAIRLLTSESASISTSATLRPEGDSKEQRILTFTYRNAPRYEYRPRSQPHGGAVNLTITGRAPNRLVGNYWTDRFTMGDIELELLERRTDYPTFDDTPKAVE
ncbi:Cap15 family cyclic dinucleotide receptor domain-containing protein [Micromonospora aurantiaca (nom. illeg.)]